MKFKMLVKGKSKEWWETYSQYDEVTCQQTAQMKAESIVSSYNSTLQPTQTPRQLLKVELISFLDGVKRNG